MDTGAFIQEFKSINDMYDNFKDERVWADLNGSMLHAAWYGYGDSSGESFVLYEKDGVLYENNASHCSCFGLEGQWAPERTSWPVLAGRDLRSSSDGAYEAHRRLQEIVQQQLVSRN